MQDVSAKSKGHLMTVRSAVATRLLLVLALAGPAASPALAQDSDGQARGDALASHHASYEMTLASVRAASSVVGAAGTMDYAFTQGCDGWTVETTTDLTLASTQGPEIQSRWEFVSWEARDGRSYRFRIRNTRNDALVEAYDGEATLDADGAGQAVFHLADGTEETYDLPKGTLFPTAHTLKLIHLAQAGTRFYAAPVFDGSAIQGAFSVSAAIGARSQGTPSEAAPESPLLTSESWPITLAFFSDEPEDEADTGDLPKFEVSLHYRANGVAERILQDFGDFSLRGTLAEITKTERQGC